MSGHKIIEGLKQAIAGDFGRVTIEGQTWVRVDKQGVEPEVDEIVMSYRTFINDRPQLLSLLYDINMLPEQCVSRACAIRLAAFCEVWAKLPEEYHTKHGR